MRKLFTRDPDPVARMAEMIGDQAAMIACLRAALRPVAHELGGEATHKYLSTTDWNPEAHFDKQVTLTIGECRAILDLVGYGDEPTKGEYSA